MSHSEDGFPVRAFSTEMGFCDKAGRDPANNTISNNPVKLFTVIGFLPGKPKNDFINKEFSW